MKRQFAYFAIATALTLGTMGCDWATGSSTASHSYSQVKVHASRDAATPVVPGAEARLVTNDAGATFTFKTKELAAGHAYTLWVAIINAPENCAADPCTPADILVNTAAVQADVTYGAGHVVGGDGRGTFSGHLSIGNIPNSWFGNGFTNPRGAEIHLILNDHGPVIPGMVANQISTYRGGCTDESIPPPFPATARADGIPGPNTCQLYQFGILQQS